MSDLAKYELDTAHSGCVKLCNDLTNPEILFEHVMNIDITEDCHLYELFRQISGRIREAVEEDGLLDEQREELTAICEATLRALRSHSASVVLKPTR